MTTDPTPQPEWGAYDQVRGTCVGGQPLNREGRCQPSDTNACPGDPCTLVPAAGV